MLLTIAIISGIGCILNLISYLSKGQVDINILWPTILVLSVWESCLPLAIIVICLTVLIGIIGYFHNEK